MMMMVIMMMMMVMMVIEMVMIVMMMMVVMMVMIMVMMMLMMVMMIMMMMMTIKHLAGISFNRHCNKYEANLIQRHLTQPELIKTLYPKLLFCCGHVRV